MPGFPELILLITILFIIFGAKGFPALGAALGRLLAKRSSPPQEQGSTSSPSSDQDQS